MVEQPLAEVFGFPVDNETDRARRYRQNRLCPFNNRIANCTKDKANDPLGVCSIFDSDAAPVITCPVRFRQDWHITEHAAAFFFEPGTRWTSLGEVRLNDIEGKLAGNIDLVLVAYDDRGQVLDFGALEVQAVYISGNVRRPYEHFMHDRAGYRSAGMSQRTTPPRPDYLSSSRKRLVPQLLYKGGILAAWNKRQAVALQRSFFESLPPLPTVSPEEANVAWIIYDLVLDPSRNEYDLSLVQTVFTRFGAILDQIATPAPGPVGDFISDLQEKLDQKFEEGGTAPDTTTLADLL